MTNCRATTKKKKPCPIKVESWRLNGLCHIHDPDGTFRQQVRSGEARAMRKAATKGPCQHTWYMRDPGITCTKCGVIWDKDTASES